MGLVKKDWPMTVGWGNDLDDNVSIVAVIDLKNRETCRDIRRWAECCDWWYVTEYSL